MKKLLLRSMLLLCALIVGSGNLWAATETTTCTFSSKAWAANNGGTWTSGKDGNQFTNGRGVQITTGTSGANGTSGTSFENVSQVVVTYSTNASAGAGSISIKIGNGTAQTKDITKTGGTTDRTITYTFSPSESGKVNITVTCTTNSIYVKSVAITTGSPDPVSVTGVTLDESELSLAVGESATLTPTVAPSNATNKNVSWESSNDDVATVVDGEVTAVAEGTATITVTTEDGSKTATCDVTVTPAPAVAATFDFTSNDVWGFPEDTKTITENTYSNGSYSIKLKGSTGNGYYFDTTAHNLLLGKSGATLTFPTFTFNVKKIKVYGTEGTASASVTFNIFVGSDEVSTEATSSQVNHDFDIAAASQAAGTKYVLKVTNTNNMRITKIEVYGYETTPAVSADGWATYVTTNPCRFAEGDAFVVTSAGDKVHLQSVTDVPNNTPVLLKGTGAKTAEVLPAASAISNELAISNGGSVDGYVLAKKSGVVGFYKWNGGLLTSGKVYLPSSAVTTARDFLGFDFENGETTALTLVNSEKRIVNSEVYDLQGRKVANPTRGLYIVNGRKVVIK